MRPVPAPSAAWTSPLSWAPPVLAVALVLPVASCAPEKGERREHPSGPPAEAAAQPEPQHEWAIALHGGADVVGRQDRGSAEGDAEEYFASLASALEKGATELASGKAAVAVVETVVMALEDDPKFNAGRGATFNSRTLHELDAAIMDGRTLSCGAVAGTRNVRYPIQLARQVMERSPYVLLSGQGADDLARELRLPMVLNKYFDTGRRRDDLDAARRTEHQGGEGERAGELGAVGVVALDRYGNLAAGTSAGGFTNERYGRIGAAPVIGAATYADNRTAAVSCTGRGEELIRHNTARALADRMELGGESLAEAADAVIHDALEPGDGGLIAVDRLGNIALAFNTPGMFRGAADSSGRFEIGIWDEVRSTPSPVPPSASVDREASGDAP